MKTVAVLFLSFLVIAPSGKSQVPQPSPDELVTPQQFVAACGKPARQWVTKEGSGSSATETTHLWYPKAPAEVWLMRAPNAGWTNWQYAEAFASLRKDATRYDEEGVATHLPCASKWAVAAAAGLQKDLAAKQAVPAKQEASYEMPVWLMALVATALVIFFILLAIGKERLRKQDAARAYRRKTGFSASEDIEWVEHFDPPQKRVIQYADRHGEYSERTVAIARKGKCADGRRYIGAYDHGHFKTFREDRVLSIREA